MAEEISRINEIINKINNRDFRILTENVSDYWDERKDKLKQELLTRYASEGLTQRHVNFMVDVFGTKYANSVSPKAIKNIMKNPSRFLKNVSIALGDSDRYKQYVNDVNNQSGDNLISLFNKINSLESEVSNLNKTVNDLVNELKQKYNDDEVNKILDGLEPYKVESVRKKFKDKISKTDLTGKKIIVIQDERLVSKKVLVDIDFSDNETIASVKNKINQYIQNKVSDKSDEGEVNGVDDVDLGDEELERADQIREKLKGYLIIDTDQIERLLESKDRVLPEGFRRLADTVSQEDTKKYIRSIKVDQNMLYPPKTLKLLAKSNAINAEFYQNMQKYGFDNVHDLVNLDGYNKHITFKVDDPKSAWYDVLKYMSTKENSVIYSDIKSKPEFNISNISQSNGIVSSNEYVKIKTDGRGSNISNIEYIEWSNSQDEQDVLNAIDGIELKLIKDNGLKITLK